MNTLISFLGTTLDNCSERSNRWSLWRPSVALSLQDDLHFERFFLLYQASFQELCRQVVEDIKSCSPNTEVIPIELPLNNPWDFEEVYTVLYDFSIEYDFISSDDEFYIHITTGSHVEQICLFLLNESHHLPGRLIQSSPSKRDRAKGRYTIIDLDLSRYDRLAQRFAVSRNQDLAFLKSGIATRNPHFNELIATIEQVSLRSTAPILLSGPTGAGKSKLAGRIYQLKKQNRQLAGSFVEVNCATLRGDQAMSTLFGHTKGAFTGAVKDRSGLLKAADQGLLFLDEVAELGLDEQAMLLRAIEEKRFFRLGADQEDSSSFQLLCGTNCDLEAAVSSGRFRADLLERINLWHFHLPGLAQRREDIEPNIEYELEEYTRRSGERITFNSEARKAFLEYALSENTPWRGNFRELNAMITRMATLAPAGRIDLTTLRNELARNRAQTPIVNNTKTLLSHVLGQDYLERYDRFELIQLQDVLEVCRDSSSLSEAGRKLFAVSRVQKCSGNDSDRLSKYLAKFSLSWQALKNRLKI